MANPPSSHHNKDTFEPEVIGLDILTCETGFKERHSFLPGFSPRLPLVVLRVLLDRKIEN